MRRLSIGLKLSIIYLIIAIPLITLIAIAYLDWYQARTQGVLERRIEVANSGAIDFALFINELDKSMQVAGSDIVNSKESPAEASSTLGGLLFVYPIDNAVFTDATGTVVASTDNHLIGQSLADHPAFKTIIAKNKQTGIEPVTGHPGSSIGFHLTQAIRDDSGMLRGIVGYFVDVKKLHDVLPKPISGASNIIDSDGNLIYDSEFPENALLLPHWGKYDFVKSALSGKTAVNTNFVYPPTKKERIIAEVPIKEFGWAAGSSTDASQTLVPIKQSTIISASFAVIILLFALSISTLVARRIINSLSYLADKANAVGEGRFDEPIKLTTGDEIENVAHSLDEARLNLKNLVESLNESNQRTQLLLQSTDEGIYGVDTREYCTFINRAALQMLGYKSEEMLGKNIHKLIHYKHSDGSLYPEEECPVYRANQTGQGIRLDNEVFWRKDGTSFPVEYSSYPIVDDGVIKGAVVSFSNITERKQIQRLRDALNDINKSITSTLDFNEIMQKVVIEATEAVGCEAALINLREDDYWIVKYGYGYSQELIGARLSQEQARLSTLTARAKETIVIDDAYGDERLDRETIERYNLRSAISMPLKVRDKVIGALLFIYKSAPTTFSAAQIDFANNLSASISLALENARLYSTERTIADTLQESLLIIPHKIEGIDFGYLYRSATEATIVGGDFYDLFELGHGKVGIVIGDVSGKGVEAAAITALVRNTIRAYALEGYAPQSVIAKTNDAVVGANYSKSAFVTVLFGTLDIVKGYLVYCSAGHPPGLVKKRSGGVELLVTDSPLIGAFAGLNYIDNQASLEVGDVLIFYTDGVIEARCDGVLFGEERLIRFIDDLKPMSTEDIPRAIFNNLILCSGGKLSDDIALLAISIKQGQ